ncbi:methyltransferase domain-containing protein [Thalassobaculum sp. OXR-137]|uniref:methyltransferase domain-containing protein n=1 Tax=Thalassobaculum sp. OXR-137 TaxID=3100173 RepID=UPI002AC95EE3|nr:methyltransferase domain-containing protein [Thalassobaculum sp. OXR-137]WPZ36175.1 methyltransferase domain-containing protein [Thalassobaculum sp. OXR-137]
MADVCPICEAEGAPVVYRAEAQLFWVVSDPALTDRFADIALRQCRDCGHVFHSDLGADTIDEIYRRQALTNRPVSAAMAQRYETLIAMLGSERLVGRRILEVGGGTGSLALLLAGLGSEVTVVEPNESLPDLLAEGEESIRLINAFFGPDTLDETFDGVICRQVVEHIADIRPFVRALAAAAAPGGFVYLEVPTLEFIAETGAYMDVHVQHLHYLDAAARERLLADAGLAVVATHQILGGHDIGVLAVPSTGASRTLSGFARTDLSLVPERRDLHRRALAEVAGRPERSAVYAATSQGVTFYAQFPPDRAPNAFIDDNPDTIGRLAYGRGGPVTIQARNRVLLDGLDDIFIGAYHHEASIAEKLAADGYRGRLWSIDPHRPTIERLS